MRLVKDAFLVLRWEKKRTGTPVNPCVVDCSETPTSRWAQKTHQMASRTHESVFPVDRDLSRSSMAEVLVLENKRQPTSLTIFL